MDYNSSTNQKIKGQFVDRHVHACVTSMVCFILSHASDDTNDDAPFTYDDMENAFAYPEWNKKVVGEDLYFPGGDQNALEDFKENFTRLEEESQDLLDAEEISEETHERNVDLINEAKAEFEALDEEGQDVYEWWIVSDYLMEKLKEQGEVVIDGYPCLWGRGCSGQAILLDGSISRVCEEMGILDGQEHSWADNK